MELNVNIVPQSYLPEIRVSQNDNTMRTIKVNLIDEKCDPWTPPAGASAVFTGTKPSGLGFTLPCTISGSAVTFMMLTTACNEVGRFPAEVRFTDGSGGRIGSCNVMMIVERDPHSDDTTDGDAEELINEITALLEEIREEHQQAIEDIADAKTDALEDIQGEHQQALQDIGAAKDDALYAIAADVQAADAAADRAEQAAEETEQAMDAWTNMSAEATTLPAGSEASASYSEGVLSLGIPKGDKGDQGEQGDPGATGATPDMQIGTVETLDPGEDATATITGTPEQPILSLGIPQGEKGDPGDVSMEQLLALAVYDEASGEIASFPDGSDGFPMKSLKASLEPIQDGTPWIGTDHDTAPYLHRAMPTQSNDYNRESGVIVGGTVGWNQLGNQGTSPFTVNGVTFTQGANGHITTSGTGTTSYFGFLDRVQIYADHVYLNTSQAIKNPNNVSFDIGALNVYVYAPLGTSKVMRAATSVNSSMGIQHATTGADFTGLEFTYNLIDLTAMFGPTIADYIYSLEQATAGAGVAWFKKYFPENYYPYSANTLQSVQATAHKTYDADGNVLGNYALDSSVTLRGIPKLDASNNLYYDGDTYASDGTVTRNTILRAYQSGDESLANAITDGTNTVVYSANASTETAQAYTNPQIVDPDGTEEYVTANSVPVGHDSTYSLVCPISGYDEVEANVTGVNVWDEEWENGYISSTGQPAPDPTAIRSKNFVRIFSNTTYYGKSPVPMGVRFYDKNQTFVGTASVNNATFATPSNAQYLKFYCANTATYNNDISINYPSTDHEYHSGTNNATYTADLPQTVYGGTVDLVSGEVVVDMAIVDLGSLNWTYEGTRGNFEAKPTPTAKSLFNALCSVYPFVGSYSVLVDKSCAYIYGNYVAVKDSTYGTDATAFKTAMNGVQLCYELATPQTIQLTPQEIRTLYGTNNVWGDGDVYVKYVADTKLYILKVLS